MRSAEGRGRTLDEAVDAALIELGESRRNVDVKVLSEGSEETVVEVTVIEAESAAAAAPYRPAAGIKASGGGANTRQPHPSANLQMRGNQASVRFEQDQSGFEEGEGNGRRVHQGA